MKLSLLDFVNYSKKVGNIFKVKSFMSKLAFLFSGTGHIICLFSILGNKTIANISSSFRFLFAIFMIGIGTIFLIKFGLIYMIDKKIKNKSKLYTMVGNIIYPKFIFRLSVKNRLLTVLSLLLTVTITLIGIMSITLTYPIKAIDRLNPSVIEYTLKDNMTMNTNTKKVVEENSAKMSTIHLLRINVKPSIPITDNGKKQISHLDIVKYSEYKKILENQNRQDVIVELNGRASVLLNYYPTSKPIGLRVMLPNHEEIMIGKVDTNNIISFANSVTTLVVNDAYYEKIDKDNLGEKILLIAINGAHLRDSKQFYENFRDINNVQSSYQKKYSIIRDNASTFIFITFIALLFVICTASILYFTNLVSIIENKYEYNYLKQIGYSNKNIKYIINKEIGLFYKIPMSLGILNGSFITFAARFIFVDNLIGSRDIFIIFVMSLSIFIFCYLIFYSMTKKSVIKLLSI